MTIINGYGFTFLTYKHEDFHMENGSYFVCETSADGLKGKPIIHGYVFISAIDIIGFTETHQIKKWIVGNDKLKVIY